MYFTIKTVRNITYIYTTDYTNFLLIQTKLDSCGLHYVPIAQISQDLFALGKLGTGYNLAVGEMRIVIRNDDAEIARNIINDIQVTPHCCPAYLRIIAALMLISPIIIKILGK